MIKSQDIVISLWLCLSKNAQTYAEMGRVLHLSASEAHGAVRRLAESRLWDGAGRKMNYGALCNFLVHGVPYTFPVHLKEVTMGIPTAWGESILSQENPEVRNLPPVWPDPQGPVQGVAVKPLYPSAPRAARENPELYDLLALVDILRLGQSPERRKAGEEIFRRMTAFASA